MKVNVVYPLAAKVPSIRTSMVMDHFGIEFDVGEHVIVKDLSLDIEQKQIVAFTGPSGSGKSSIMRAVAENIDEVIDIDHVALPDEVLIDGLDLPCDEAVAMLTLCGLGEPRLMLRTPSELSDGQRFRYRIACALSQKPKWLLIDEFTATLDRTLAKVIAFNVHRLAKKYLTGFLLATTHEDILDDLGADVHVACQLDGPPSVTYVKKTKPPPKHQLLR
ncbi:ATP-binding cassette domain-containing protein [Calycomorphotria hydatis]|uniref:Toxin RTX-I translocation ATP-binding protein n=1 Tax=Calycomorphotria hydatis TaxID=2528027 RepID=A0A517TFB2_9PLAN|nr:ATP-binding cassette domain-containing protein [Calycomorphotria hydatis]QDT67055.1 Toxin RTX-I translocation ATP-binding protein [Calycomorphotria hydatis]